MRRIRVAANTSFVICPSSVADSRLPISLYKGQRTKDKGPHPMLALVNIHNPLLWAILIGWILTVVLHEFAHGLVGYLGGDYTVKERGGLSLNPLQYVDPVMSLLLPAVFLMMGGVPLPGGATFIRRDLLRGHLWDSL